ncbi:hypothetical protein HKD37_11G032220 [Glycine soja]
MEEFNFPRISDTCAHNIGSPPLWNLSPVTSPNPYYQGNKIGKNENRMNMLWEDFNEELYSTKGALRLEEGYHHASISRQTSAVPDENGMKNIQPKQLEIQEMGRRESALGKDIEQQPTLLEEYHLRNKLERSPATYISSHGFTENSHFPEGKEEIYEKKLKDAAARELMLAEEATMLDRELKRERAKASVAIKSLRQKMEDKLKTELEQKELAKVDLNATITNENTTQIEKMAEVNVNVRFLLK